MKRHFAVKIGASLCAVSVILTSSALQSYASKYDDNSDAWRHIGYAGDLNNDRTLSIADMVLLSEHLLGKISLTTKNSYYVGNYWSRCIGVDGYKPEECDDYFHTADLDRDGKITVFDLVELRHCITDSDYRKVWRFAYSEYTLSKIDYNEDFIYPSIQQLAPFMPSHGTADTVLFYVDFPDAQYDYIPDNDYLRRIMFGEEDQQSSEFPFESAAAFYKRSSKGAMNLEGDVFRYTAQYSIDSYAGKRVDLVAECLAAFDDEVDFSQFDSNDDGRIDNVIVVVPGDADETYWWPAATYIVNHDHIFDDKLIGHIVVGNCEVKSDTDHTGFSKTLLHEMGHSMGLPDYYVYNNGQGMTGDAGWENMDDDMCDMGALSKLLLGWYKKDQVSVFDPEAGQQTFVLKSSQSEEGNCVIIPKGIIDEDLDGEYFVMEYNTPGGNNTYVKQRYYNTRKGLRIFHADTETNIYTFYKSYIYDNHNAEDFLNGRRVVRLVNDTEDSYYYDNYFHAGDIIDNDTSGFGWYDDDNVSTVDPGVTITVDSMDDDECVITISVK